MQETGTERPGPSAESSGACSTDSPLRNEYCAGSPVVFEYGCLPPPLQDQCSRPSSQRCPFLQVALQRTQWRWQRELSPLNHLCLLRWSDLTLLPRPLIVSCLPRGPGEGTEPMTERCPRWPTGLSNSLLWHAPGFYLWEAWAQGLIRPHFISSWVIDASEGKKGSKIGVNFPSSFSFPNVLLSFERSKEGQVEILFFFFYTLPTIIEYRRENSSKRNCSQTSFYFSFQ